MKKILCIVLFILLACSVAHAQTWFTANQVTVAWDAVAKVQPTDAIKYQVYLRIGTTGDGAAYGTETEAIQQTITFSAEGSWFIGVKALRYVQGEATPIPSATISWSNEGEDTNNNPFGVRYLVAPASVGGIRRVP